MSHSTQEPLRFPPVNGLTVRGHFDGGALSSDFGPLLLRGVDRQIGLTERLARAFEDQRHPSYIEHPIRALFAQRIYQIACAYEDGNDANPLRSDPMFKLALERMPLDPDSDLASALTFSRLENAVTRKDLYRMAHAVVDPFIASYATPPALIVWLWTIPRTKPMGSRSRSFTTRLTRATAISRCSSSKASRAASSPLSCALANVLGARRTPRSSNAC